MATLEPAIAAHITRNPDILGGKPIIRGTRIAVELVVDWVESGISIDEVLADYPNLTRDDIEAAIAFATPEASTFLVDGDPSGGQSKLAQDSRG